MFYNKNLKSINKALDKYFKENLTQKEYERISSENKLNQVQYLITHAQKNETKVQDILKAMPDPVFVRDNDRNIIFWSKSMEELTGYSESEVLGKKCNEIFRASICADCAVEKCIRIRSCIKKEEVIIKNKKGEDVTVLASASGLYDSEGNPDGGLEILRDITREKELLNSIREAALNVSASSQQLSATSEESTSAIEELASYTNQVLDITMKGKKISDDTSETAKKGQVASSIAIEKMDMIEEAVEESNKMVLKMNELGKEIKKILDLITGITEQTNLLALNAAIEAARAGESGRGFAVVAEQIRKLAEESKNATSQVQTIIGQVLEGADNSYKSMSVVKDVVKEGKEALNNTVKQLEIIKAGVEKTEEYMLEIASSSDNINASTQEQSAAMEEIAGSAENLSQLSEDLNKGIQDFEL
ncbi:methyl-accepting chemotaxis protein [Caldisalinibacter kiritimatiensis]|uniref:Methyl-accepting chemotaxis sensory transducer n=1 Tax=Caldisalinibacter kiritimatiensis TaxID=1304284 RepID=R1AT20_9FIRM|nr:methyl-accepting chemotaxis protein [Caldisalinibacter kiritimatiensis]EOD00288.1 methyl-accepting chemotaxis sensory transducer [Caldisalinibacter kiritimatiensis]